MTILEFAQLFATCDDLITQGIYEGQAFEDMAQAYSQLSDEEVNACITLLKCNFDTIEALEERL